MRTYLKRILKRVEYILKDFLLAILSAINSYSKSSNNELNLNYSNKVLIIRLNKIGDALVTTPLINTLKKKKDIKIFVLADRKNFFAFDNNPDVEKVIIFEKGFAGFIKTVRLINSMKFDVVIDAHDDVSTTVSFLISSVKCRYKVGLEKSNKRIFTHTIPRPDARKYHVVERLCSIAKIFGIDYAKDDVRIIYNPSDFTVKKVDDYITNLFNERKFLLGINISAGSDARFWGVNKYRKLVDSLSEYEINTLLICHNKDFEKAKQIIDSKFIYSSQNDFDFFAAIIKKLDMLFTPDTSAVHLASSSKVPVFGLYVKYNLDEVLWTPYNSDYEIVITEESNLNNVTFEEVWSKFQPFLESYLRNSNEFSQSV